MKKCAISLIFSLPLIGFAGTSHSKPTIDNPWYCSSGDEAFSSEDESESEYELSSSSGDETSWFHSDSSEEEESESDYEFYTYSPIGSDSELSVLREDESYESMGDYCSSDDSDFYSELRDVLEYAQLNDDDYEESCSDYSSEDESYDESQEDNDEEDLLSQQRELFKNKAKNRHIKSSHAKQRRAKNQISLKALKKEVNYFAPQKGNRRKQKMLRQYEKFKRNWQKANTEVIEEEVKSKPQGLFSEEEERIIKADKATVDKTVNHRQQSSQKFKSQKKKRVKKTIPHIVIMEEAAKVKICPTMLFMVAQEVMQIRARNCENICSWDGMEKIWLR